MTLSLEPSAETEISEKQRPLHISYHLAKPPPVSSGNVVIGLIYDWGGDFDGHSAWDRVYMTFVREELQLQANFQFHWAWSEVHFPSPALGALHLNLPPARSTESSNAANEAEVGVVNNLNRAKCSTRLKSESM